MKFYFLTISRTIKSEHPPELLLNRLRQVIDPAPPKTPELLLQFGLVEDRSKDYYGSIEGNSFHLKETVSFNKGGKVNISGVINKNETGSVVTMKIEAPVALRVFFIFWLSGLGIFQLILLGDMIVANNYNIAAIIPAGMMVLAYSLFSGMHWMMFSGIFDEFEDLFTMPIVVHSKRRRR